MRNHERDMLEIIIFEMFTIKQHWIINRSGANFVVFKSNRCICFASHVDDRVEEELSNTELGRLSSRSMRRHYFDHTWQFCGYLVVWHTILIGRWLPSSGYSETREWAKNVFGNDPNDIQHRCNIKCFTLVSK